jgi:putative ATPase
MPIRPHSAITVRNETPGTAATITGHAAARRGRAAARAILSGVEDRLFDAPQDPPESGGPEPPPADGPLAARMRPRTLADFVGQEHLLGEGSALRVALESGRPHSMVLFGPPGTGKTTLARLAAEHAAAAFEELSAVNAGRAEVREVIARARQRRDAGRATIFFLDEIHRFNKAQQDALLPAVEEGLVVLIGATTENPYFEVNNALLSRAQVYELRALTAGDLEALQRRAIAAGEVANVDVGDDVIAFLAGRAGGDARNALNALELACSTARRAGREQVGLADAEDAMQRKAVLYDKGGDQHYDYISAWIKSTRGSDPDASLYYLATMLEGGEDARFIVRRMVIFASEDVGNADPRALEVAVAAAAAVEHVGMPECQFALAQAAIYLSLAPKSDAAKRSIGAARGHIRDNGTATPPAALRSSAFPLAAQALGRGIGYDSPHGHTGHVNRQEHLPDGLEDLRLYFPDDAEPALKERYEAARKARGRPL